MIGLPSDLPLEVSTLAHKLGCSTHSRVWCLTLVRNPSFGADLCGYCAIVTLVIPVVCPTAYYGDGHSRTLSLEDIRKLCPVMSFSCLGVLGALYHVCTHNDKVA